jgi:pimeloyl-ACP methyl ester carboxylesterase
MLHVIKGAGHCPHIEKAREFNEVALRFLTA